jgi:hypothetical protein
MKTDERGGASADDNGNDNLERRLSGRFAIELDRAERDYPALREKLVGTARPAARGGRGKWPRLALPITTAAALAVAVLVVGSLWSSPVTGPTLPPGPGSAAPPSGVVMGTDGIPTQIDGQHVYRVTDKAEWQSLQGSFLLGASPTLFVPSCLAVGSSLTAEKDLVQASCGGMLVGVVLGGETSLAPRSPASLTAWVGHAVALRVHTHDAEAAQCEAAQRTACEAAVVVEAVVWPVVPTQIAGERVYRAVDQASFPMSGSFLLGGLVTMPDFIPPCPAPIDHTTAENDLIPYCYWEAIDGIHVAPKVDALAELRGRIVVARVHIGDTEAASCPVSIQAQCKTAVVVEDVVWTGGAVSSSPARNPTPTPVETTPNSASSQAVGPVASDQLGPDGVPMVLNGQPVYRAASLPTTPTFMFGGKLTRDTTCAAPATPLAKPPACGYWMLDGVKIGTMVDLPESLDGWPIVAQVASGRVLAVCPGGSCTSETLVITAIVWPEQAVATPRAPLTP